MTSNTVSGMFINIKYDIPLSRIQDLLITALEGGSNHWVKDIQLEYYYTESQKFPAYDIDHPKYKVILTDSHTGEEHTMTLGRYKVGLGDMSIKYPWHAKDFVHENEDAVTGDVFLQCAVFGEVKYG